MTNKFDGLAHGAEYFDIVIDDLRGLGIKIPKSKEQDVKEQIAASMQDAVYDSELAEYAAELASTINCP